MNERERTCYKEEKNESDCQMDYAYRDYSKISFSFNRVRVRVRVGCQMCRGFRLCDSQTCGRSTSPSWCPSAWFELVRQRRGRKEERKAYAVGAHAHPAELMAALRSCECSRHSSRWARNTWAWLGVLFHPRFVVIGAAHLLLRLFSSSHSEHV